MSYSYRLILLLALLLTGLPLYAQSVTEEAKSVRAMVSGIVSYTRWPALSGPPKLCIFSSSRFSSVLEDTSTGALPYLPVIIRTEQEILVSQCDGFYFGKESPTYQVELKNKNVIMWQYYSRVHFVQKQSNLNTSESITLKVHLVFLI